MASTVASGRGPGARQSRSHRAPVWSARATRERPRWCGPSPAGSRRSTGCRPAPAATPKSSKPPAPSDCANTPARRGSRGPPAAPQPPQQPERHRRRAGQPAAPERDRGPPRGPRPARRGTVRHRIAASSAATRRGEEGEVASGERQHRGGVVCTLFAGAVGGRRRARGRACTTIAQKAFASSSVAQGRRQRVEQRVRP